MEGQGWLGTPYSAVRTGWGGRAEAVRLRGQRGAAPSGGTLSSPPSSVQCAPVCVHTHTNTQYTTYNVHMQAHMPHMPMNCKVRFMEKTDEVSTVGAY